MWETAYVSLYEKSGWKFIDDAKKAAVKPLLAAAQPPLLKTRIDDALQLEKNSKKSDFFGFCNVLADKAETCERYQSLPEYVRMKQGKKKKTGKDDNASLIPFGGSTPSGNDRQRKKILPKFLNQKCDKRHLVKDFTITRADEKKRLLIEMRSRKGKKKNSSSVRVVTLRKKLAAPTQNTHAVEDITI